MKKYNFTLDETFGKISKLPGILLWQKNKDSIYTWCNTEYYEKLGFTKIEEIIGLSDRDLPCRAAELASTFRKEDLAVLAEKNSLHFLNIFQGKNNEWSVLISTKSPYINEVKKITGILGYAVDVTSAFFNMGHVLMKINVNGYDSSKATHSYHFSQELPLKKTLTSRQTEVLFFLLRNKTAKEIACFLNVKPGTIEYHIKIIKEKFKCNTKSSLFEKAMEKGFINLIPENILKTQCSILLD